MLLGACPRLRIRVLWHCSRVPLLLSSAQIYSGIYSSCSSAYSTDYIFIHHLRSNSVLKSTTMPPTTTRPLQPSTLLTTLNRWLGRDKRTTTPLEPQAAEIASLQGMHILLVEDDRASQLMAREVLKNVGIEVTVANNGQEAIDLTTENHFDLILMDIQIPRIDGYETTRQIRKHFLATELPILAMSANILPEDEKRAEDAGMNGYIPKPIHINALYQEISAWKRQASIETTNKPATEKKVEPLSSDWPESLPGLEVSEGVHRIMGNQAFYLKILDHFNHDNQNFIQTLIDTLNKDDLPALKQQIHTLKGSAANISANALAAEALQLEQQISASSEMDKSTLRAAMRAIEARLDEVQRAIQQLKSLDHAAHGSSPQTILPDHELQGAIEKLNQLLQTFDMSAQTHYQQIQHALEQRLNPATVTLLSYDIEKLDFSSAQQRLATIKAQLMAPEG